MTEHSEHTEQSETNIPASTLSLEAVGRLLVDAREKMGLSVDEVGSRLRLQPRQVQALESGNIDALPGPAFVRGFLRNYAKLLQIDAEPLLEACRAHGAEESPRQISLHSENILIAGRARKGWAPLLVVTVVVVLALVGWFAYMEANNTKAVPEQPVEDAVPHDLPSSDMMPPSIDALPAAPATEVVPPAAVPAEPALVPEPAVGTTPAPTPAPAAPAAAEVAGSAKVVLKAGQTSWVSVRDRDGKEVFGRNVVAGSSETISGNPPLKLVIGNATDVQLSYNGSPVDLAPHIRANVARLTLE